MPISDEYKQKTIAENIAAREQEVFGYEFNIKNFEMMLERLPAVGTPRPADDPLEAAKHDLRDDLLQRLVNEKIQLQTAMLVLSVLVEQKT